MKDKLSKLAEEKLSKRALGYFRIIFAQYLVLFLKGRPATWKSAILKYIADTLDIEFIDLRLPTMDEVDLGAFPVCVQEKHGEIVFPVIKMGIPEWAMRTNNKKKNFLIVFEELNRTSPAVRNAALGILLERRIGPDFVFGDNVYMAATGNLGSADGTDVEEFDAALKSRLITVNHTDELVEWMENYAETIKDKDGKVVKKGNIHADIVAFLKDNPTDFYPTTKESGNATGENDVITNPRTWTALSKAIQANFGEEAKSEEYIGFVKEHGKSYVGPRALKFLRFIEENKVVTLEDVVKGRVSDMGKIKRDNKTEILRTFEAMDPNTLKKDTEFNRLVEFLKAVRKDEKDLLTGSLLQLAQNRMIALNGAKPGERERELKKNFKDLYEYLEKQEDEEENKLKAK